MTDQPAARRKAVSFRLPEATLALLDQARALTHQDRTEFLVAVIVEMSKDILRDQTAFSSSHPDHERLVAALDNPDRPSDDPHGLGFQTAFRLGSAEHGAFVHALDHPAPPSPELVELLHRKPVWRDDDA